MEIGPDYFHLDIPDDIGFTFQYATTAFTNGFPRPLSKVIIGAHKYFFQSVHGKFNKVFPIFCQLHFNKMLLLSQWIPLKMATTGQPIWLVLINKLVSLFEICNLIH